MKRPEAPMFFKLDWSHERVREGTATDGDFASWEEQARVADAEIEAYETARAERWKAIQAIAVEFDDGHCGPDSLTKHLGRFKHHGISNRGRWTRMVADWRRANDETKRRKTEAAHKATESARKQAAAVLYLSARGKKPVEDYDPAKAVEAANAIAFEEAVAAKVKEGGPFSFDGDDNCEECDGWDGESRRCNCGNRRVTWEMHGDFEDAWVHGEAW